MLDGDQGVEFLDPNKDGSTVITDTDDRFLYHFASYAGSYAPTRLRILRDAALHDVTKAPPYAAFLRRELRRMERLRGKSTSEPNGYLAGWVAQKALLGELEEGWRTMLEAYDRTSRDGLCRCAVDESLWVKGPYGSDKVCPKGQGVFAAFPEELALHLVELGYISPAQSAALGYDPATTDARRMASRKAATAKLHRRQGDVRAADAPAGQ